MAKQVTFDEQSSSRIAKVVRRAESTLESTAQTFPLAEQSNDANPIYFRNDSGETVPAFAAMFATGAALLDDRPFVLIDKPDTTADPILVFNGPYDIPNGGRGVAQALDANIIRCLHSGTAPSNGDFLAPENGQWYLGSDTAGTIRAIGEIDSANDQLLVTQTGSRNSVMAFGVITQSGGIAAATYTSNQYTMTDGTVSLVEKNSSDRFVFKSGSPTIEAFNWAEEALDEDKLVMCQIFEGKWFVTNMPCDGSDLTTLSG